MKGLLRYLFLLILVLLVAACSQPPATDEPPADSPDGSAGGIIEGEAIIDAIDIFILESFPVQVNVQLSGNLPDGCTILGKTEINSNGNTFDITVFTSRPADAICTEALVPFQQSVALDVLGLSAGDYTVNAGGISAMFNLAVDNVMPDFEDSSPEATAVPAAPGKIQGRLWHDVCGVRDVGGGDPPITTEGCVELDGGGFAANGILSPDEPGIEGVEVLLLETSCSGPVVGTIFTNSDGSYAFDNLAAGTYCVKIDPLANPNSSILIPGGWTSAAGGSVEVDLSAGQNIPALNFGWDFQFLPLPSEVEPGEPTPEPTGTPGANDPNCTNKVSFVSETIDDDTIVAPGTNFTKSWTLENSGSCTWTTDYKLVFESGDKMGGADASLSKNVPPGETIKLDAVLLAPDVAGTYRGDWLLENESGDQFGLGSNADKAFWVQIKVEGSVSNLDLGVSDWTDAFNNESNWFLYNTDTVRFSISDGQMRMRAKVTGGAEQWTLANPASMDDFYLEGVFKTGPACAGLDRYGFLIRGSSDAVKGYVFNISCNGQFRVYEWDGAKYNELNGWTSSAAIKTGPDQTNKVGVWAEGDTLRLYVNDILIAELEDDAYAAGKFGVLVGSTNTAPFDVFIDQISYWRLDN